MDFANLGKQFVGVEAGEAVVGVDPGDQLGEGDAHGVIYRAVDSDGHDFPFVFEARPAGVLSLDYVELQARFHGNFDGGAGDFAVAHGGMAIAKIKERARNIHGQIKGVADGNFWGVHVASEFGGDDGAACFAVGWGDADASEKRVKRDFHFVIRIERLKCGGVGRVIDGIKPDFFWEG
jgi:hypothetical protein